ncbi:hypothetical protein RYX36_034094 [Vicia faba]
MNGGIMIYSLVWGNSLVGFCVKILNSTVVIRFYYGFLTTFSIGPSYLFLLRGKILGKGFETKISATTMFITGQLMIFISIYYVPLHLALSRPHTITVLTLPYLFFNFVHKNDKHYYLGSRSKLDSEYKNPNSIRHFRIVKHKKSIKYKITMRFDKYILLQLRNYVGQIFVVFSFVSFAHYLGRTPLPYYYIEEMMRYDDRDLEEVKAVIDWEKEETNKEEEDITVYLSDKKENTFNKKLVPLEKSLVTTLFDYRKWNWPLRYIKNDHFERVVRDENSHFFP